MAHSIVFRRLFAAFAAWLLCCVAHAAVPGAPTRVVAIPGDARATIHLRAPASDGGSSVTTYTATASPGGATVSAPQWPIVFTGLTNGTAYAFTVTATNASGTGPASIASPPVKPSAPMATPAVESEQSFGLALDATGQVYAWGSDAFGQLGQSRQLIQASPLRVNGLPPITQISLSDQALALDATGQVWSWGENCAGQLGPRDGVATAPARVKGATNAIQVAAGGCWSHFLKADGTVWEFGNSGAGLRQVAGFSGIVEISGSGGSHLLARRNDGTVWAHGRNIYGQLGIGSTAPQSGVVQVPGLSGVVKVSAESDSSFALLANGEMRFWGQSRYRYATEFVTSPTNVGGLGGSAITISAGAGSLAAVRADGTVWVWDDLRAGPQQVVEMSGASTLEYGGTYNNLFSISPAGGLLARGYNLSGQLGQGSTSPQYSSGVAVPGFATGTTQVRAGGSSVLALKADGSLWFWGANSAGQSGDGAAIGSSVPLAVPIPAAIQKISTGYNFALALDTAGQVWGWGSNAFGGLDADFVNRSTPAPVAALSAVTAIAAGGGTIAYTKADGSAGWNQGQVPLSGIVGVAAAGSAAFFLRNDGVLFGVGYNSFGEIGDGTTIDRLSPVQVTGISGFVTKVVSSVSRSAALMSDGRVYTWGGDITGASLTGGTHVPRLVPSLTDAIDIAVSANGGIARRAGGGLVGWGLVYVQEQPPGDFPQTFPIELPQSIQSFALSMRQGYLIGATGLLWGWGFSDASQYLGTVGDGAYVYRPRAVVLSAHDGSGSLDANNWYLDLQPASAEPIPAASIPTALATSKVFGTAAGLGFEGSVKYKSADYGKRVNNYVLAVVPPEFFDQVSPAPGRSDMPALKRKAAKAGGYVLAQLTPRGWEDVNGQLIAYSTGVANASGGASNILGGINATLIPGARFCVGYGETGQAMLGEAALREVLLLEGAAANVSGVPCVLAGVYLDGPSTSMRQTSVTFNASIVGLSPTGSVDFRDGFASLGSVALAASNPAVARASLSTSSLDAGPHSIGAAYSGDGVNAAATNMIALVHEVRPAASGSQTSLFGPASALSGAETVFGVTVTGNSPTGTVQFRDASASLGSPVALVEGTATLRTSSLGLGSHSISAAYSGDVNNTASTSNALDHLVANTIATDVSLTVSTNAPKIGTPVTLTAVVSGTSPTGTVRFHDNGVALGSPIALTNGMAAHTTAMLAAGTHVITASYSGDGGNPQATSPARVVDVTLEIDPAQANADIDNDGLSNATEAAEGRNPLLKDNDIFANARLFAMQQYRDFLGREGDSGGVTHWTNQLSSGAQNRGQMVETYFNSPEFQGTGAPMARLYFAYFLRIPDYGGLTYWTGRFRSGDSLEAISNLFATSPEFVATYGALDSAGFVDRVYRNVLGRAPDSGGLAHWTAQVNGGMTRGQMMVAFSESPEYRVLIDSEIYITMMYVGMLRRSPDPGGFAHWVSYREQGNSGLALVNAFLAAPEYRSRFLP